MITDLEALPELEKWPGVQAVIAVETIRTAHQHALVTSDYRFYIASLVRSAAFGKTMPQKIWPLYAE